MTILLSLVVAFLFPLVSGYFLLTDTILSRLPKALLDIPCARSLHDKPVPRIGGICLWLGVLSAWLILPIVEIGWWPILYLCVVTLIFVSFLDDWWRLSPIVRLIVHLVVSIVWVYSLCSSDISWGILLVLALSLSWMINLFNFMDGSDGLAGCMAFMGFGFYGFAAFIAGDLRFALVNWVISLASLAFLFFNFPPARMFMGDAGSIPLGFLAGAFGIMGWKMGIWPFFFPVIVFSFFIMDATVTLFKRLWRGEKVWHAHCSHYYQRIAKSRERLHGHRHVLKIGCAIMFLSGIAGIVGIYFKNLQMWLVLWCLWYLYFFIKIDKKYKETKIKTECVSSPDCD